MPKGYFTPFTEAQETQIKEEYLTKALNQLSREVNATSSRIKRFLKRNGLKIPEEILKKRIQDSYKKPGHTPYNTGLKQKDYMSAEAIKRSAQSRFKKGGIPPNTLKLNTIVQRKDSNGKLYAYIKTAKGFESYQRYLWEKNFGKVKENHIISFKDNDTNNFDLQNLEMISKEENMLRNSKSDFPKEIIPTLVLINRIKKQLKN